MSVFGLSLYGLYRIIYAHVGMFYPTKSNQTDVNINIKAKLNFWQNLMRAENGWGKNLELNWISHETCQQSLAHLCSYLANGNRKCLKEVLVNFSLNKKCVRIIQKEKLLWPFSPTSCQLRLCGVKRFYQRIQMFILNLSQNLHN